MYFSLSIVKKYYVYFINYYLINTNAVLNIKYSDIESGKQRSVRTNLADAPVCERLASCTRAFGSRVVL